jgi:hypothetical protein
LSTSRRLTRNGFQSRFLMALLPSRKAIQERVARHDGELQIV